MRAGEGLCKKLEVGPKRTEDRIKSGDKQAVRLIRAQNEEAVKTEGWVKTAEDLLEFRT